LGARKGFLFLRMGKSAGAGILFGYRREREFSQDHRGLGLETMGRMGLGVGDLDWFSHPLSLPAFFSSFPPMSGYGKEREILSNIRKREKENILSSGHPARASLGTGTGFLVLRGEGWPTDESA